jgi:hypothetical protein
MYKFRARSYSNNAKKNKLITTDMHNQIKRHKIDHTSNNSRFAYQQYQENIVSQFDNLSEIPDSSIIDGYEEPAAQIGEIEPAYLRTEYRKIEPSSLPTNFAIPRVINVTGTNSTSPTLNPTLHEHMLSTFDSLQEIPDTLCIESEISAVPEGSNSNILTKVLHLNTSTEVLSNNIAVDLSPDSATLPTSPTPLTPPSSTPTIPSKPIILNNANAYGKVPAHFNSLQRRRFFSNLRLQYLM